MGIAAILFSISLPVTLEFYQSHLLDSERDTVLSLLRETRSQSMINYGNAQHGLYISPTSYTIFQGTSFAARTTALDQSFPRATSVTITGPTEIIFDARSGKTSASSLSFLYGSRGFTIDMNSEGMIDWSL